MDIKQYLPYYIGREFITNNSQGVVNIKTLHLISLYWDQYKGFKLKVRKFESLTEMEMHDLLCLRNGDKTYIGNKYRPGANLITGTAGNKQYGVDLSQLTIEVAHYCFRKGFWLFSDDFFKQELVVSL